MIDMERIDSQHFLSIWGGVWDTLTIDLDRIDDQHFLSIVDH